MRAKREVSLLKRHRTDDTQASIVDTLRSCGVLVWPIAQPCDLLCLYGGRYFLLDCDGVTDYRKRDQRQLELIAQFLKDHFNPDRPVPKLPQVLIDNDPGLPPA